MAEAKTKSKAKAAKTKTSAPKTRAKKTSGQDTFSEEARQRAAYFNWLDRGAPLWDDQSDWFSVS